MRYLLYFLTLMILSGVGVADILGGDGGLFTGSGGGGGAGGGAPTCLLDLPSGCVGGLN